MHGKTNLGVVFLRRWPRSRRAHDPIGSRLQRVWVPACPRVLASLPSGAGMTIAICWLPRRTAHVDGPDSYQPETALAGC
jgi:hypothetical protein